MAFPKRKIVGLCLSVALITGCTSIKVIRNPDEGDTGVRFYRPKPYLLVTPADATGRLVNMKVEYLPDFNEEYSAHLKGKASVALKDGWNLVGVNTKEAPKEEKAEPPAKIEDIKLPPAVVSATNVPIGYYESVYGMAGSRKFLQGWRYIGMTILGGGQPNVCRVPGHNPNCPPGGGAGGAGGAVGNGCISGPLYGLVFFNGVMTFRQLEEIANNQLCPTFVNPAPPEAAAVPSPGRINIEQDKPSGGIEIKKEATPPLPGTSTPSGSASLDRPKFTPSLVTLKPGTSPATTPPALAKPTAASTTKPAPTATYAPIAKNSVAPVPVASTGPLKPTPPKNASAGGLPSLDQDPLSGPLPGLDQDLFRTGSSPRP
jgi:hypothetical protein